MSRTYKDYNRPFRFRPNKMKAYCALFGGTSIRFWYDQISFQNKEEVRNANRSLNKRTRQYLKKQLNIEVSDFLAHRGIYYVH